MNFIHGTYYHQTFNLKNRAIFISIFLGVVFIAALALKQDKQLEPSVLHMPSNQKDGVQVYTLPVIEIPEKLFFAGEEVPLQDPEVLQRIDRELHINTFWHTNTILLLKRSHMWFDELSAIVKSYGIPEDFAYLPIIESDLRNVVSPRKAVGFWQLLEGTAKELGLEVAIEVDERYDPIKSTHAACKFLLKSYNRMGSWTMAAATYNAGITGVNRSIQTQQIDSYWDLLLNEETARYVPRMIAIKLIMESPADFGFDLEPKHLYPKEITREVVVSTSIPNLAEWAFSQGINYKILKRYNPWLRKNTLTVARGKNYIIQLPVDSYWKMPDKKILQLNTAPVEEGSEGVEDVSGEGL